MVISILKLKFCIKLRKIHLNIKLSVVMSFDISLFTINVFTQRLK